MYHLCLLSSSAAHVPCADFSASGPVYNQHYIYQCVQMSHAGNDKILYILKNTINKEYKYF